MKLSLLTIALCSTVLACKGQTRQDAKYTYNNNNNNKEAVKAVSKNLGDRYFAASTVLDKKVDSFYQRMNNTQRAAQMIMIASSEKLGYPYSSTVKPDVTNGYAGNVLFLKGTKSEFINQFQYLDKQLMAGLSPLFACDCEPTLLHNKFSGVKRMRATGSLRTKDAVDASVDSINNVMDEMGITVNFAPIVDISKNKAIISNRSFGNDTALIRNQSSAFVFRTQNDGKAATVKHFPGHGAVIGDTHKQSVFINGKMTELSTFQSVINSAQPIFVMVGHITVKNNPDGFNTENGRPATTSRKIVTDLLREKLDYKGIITTDAMNMQASKNFPGADWEAAKAGVDLVLMPLNAKSLNQKIAKELEAQSVLGKQFEQSVKRIIRLKILQQEKI